MPENGIPELTEITRTIASTHSNDLALKYIPVVFCFAIHLDKIVNVYANRMLLHTFLPTKGRIKTGVVYATWPLVNWKRTKTGLAEIIYSV